MNYRYVVKGKVQGVGFRFFVQRLGLARGATGRVWNRADGAVELVTSDGELRELLLGGPGRPKSVERYETPEPTAEGFEIGPTR